MIEALKQVEGGRKVEEVGRQYGVSKHTIYGWKAKYRGHGGKRGAGVKQLREENARLKKLVADLSLDKDIKSCDAPTPLPAPSLRAPRETLRHSVPQRL
jgi:putative transposase